ncbi:MAG: hypothetical protein AB7G93_07275 [Bdellovibrionales bacterium]
MQELKAYARAHMRTWIQVALALLLLFQFAGFVSVFSAHIDPRSLLAARDADGSHIVGTAERTRWYKDNGETAYGAFFYRLVHTYSSLAGREFALPSSKVENRERAHHLAVMTLSLVSVFAISFLLASLVFRRLELRLALTAMLTALFLSNETWATFVYRAHPDILFGVAILGAFLLTAQGLRRPQEKIWFYLSALAWGASGMVKLTFVLFLPALLFLWVPPFTKENFKRALHYYLWMLPSYLVLGFPQSFNFPRSIRFLLYQSQFSLPATMESATTWARLLVHQMLWPLLLLLVLRRVSDHPVTLQGRWRLLAVILFPLAVIFKQNSEYRSDYYLIPVVASLLAWFALQPRVNLADAFPKVPVTNMATAIAFLVVWLSVGLVPSKMEAELTPTLTCRDDATRVYLTLHEEIERGRVFVTDPYVPFDRTRTDKKARSSWENTWARVKEVGADGVVIYWPHASGYIQPGEPSHGRQVDSPNWRDMRTFYLSFQGQEETQDPDGTRWTKQFSSNCGWEIWLKER